MSEKHPCPLCGDADIDVRPLTNRDVALIQCDRCGRFIVSSEAWMLLRSERYQAETYRLSALTRRSGKLVIEILTSNIDELLSRSPAPTSPFAVLDRLLVHIHGHAPSLTGYTDLSPKDYPLFTLQSAKELGEFLNQLVALDYADGGPTQDGNYRYRPTLKGWERVDSLRQHLVRSDQAFVAMWFTPELEPAWTDGFAPALKDAGWTPVRIDRIEHNDKIDDRIVAEIRRSGLVVADFTGQRGGVYFEAGFALGLGIPLIWTVRDTDKDKVHFDTRQYNHIIWKTAAELRERLRDRVLATVERVA